MKTTNGMGVGANKFEGRMINGDNRETVGDSVYQARLDNPSASEFHAGSVSHKEGYAKGSQVDPTSGPKTRVTADSLGARYAIQITHRPGYVENASTLANGRLVPAVISRSQAFGAE